MINRGQWVLLSGANLSVTETPLTFVAIAPCRVADSRTTTAGGLGCPIVLAETRNFPILSGSCAIPSTAYSLNVTAIPAGHLSYHH